MILRLLGTTRPFILSLDFMQELNEVSQIHASLLFPTEVFSIWWRILIVFLGVIKFPRIILFETEQNKPIRLIKTLISISALITIYF